MHRHQGEIIAARVSVTARSTTNAADDFGVVDVAAVWG